MSRDEAAWLRGFWHAAFFVHESTERAILANIEWAFVEIGRHRGSAFLQGYLDGLRESGVKS